MIGNLVSKTFSLRLPQRGFGASLFWNLLPLLFLLFSLSCSLLLPCTWTRFLPPILLLSCAAIFYGRLRGLCAVYGLFLASTYFYLNALPKEVRFWHVGLLLSFALDFYIFFLSLKEMEGIWMQMRQEGETHVNLMHQKERDCEQIRSEKEEERRQFEERIEELKKEIEQRRIEKAQQEHLFGLVQGEIELLSGQKEEWTSTLREVREERLQSVLKVGELQNVYAASEVAMQERILAIQWNALFNVPQAEKISEESRHALAQTEGKYKQLREQFEEKSQILSQTRKELFAAEGKILKLMIEKNEEALEPSEDFQRRLEKEVVVLGEEILCLEEEILLLEDLQKR